MPADPIGLFYERLRADFPDQPPYAELDESPVDEDTGSSGPCPRSGGVTARALARQLAARESLSEEHVSRIPGPGF
jgi:hypothetical protein